jgi:hypothetical protein
MRTAPRAGFRAFAAHLLWLCRFLLAVDEIESV